MKRSTKKVLGLAASSVVFSGGFFSTALASTYTFTGTGANNAWTTATDWSPNTVPTSTDVAYFSPNPPSINVGSASSVGAILDNYTGGNVTIAGSQLTLYGQTLTVAQFGETLTNEPNVVAAIENGTGASLNNVLTINDNLALENAQNVMIASAENGGLVAGTPGQTITLGGNISNAGSTAAQLTLLGGGTVVNYGAFYNLTGTNSFTGGLVIGTTDATQGAQVEVSPSAVPSTGTITVNEQSQLEFASSGTYGAGTTLVLNSPGVGPGISAGSSGGLRTAKAATNVVWAGTLDIGTTTTNSTEPGYVVISATGSNDITIAGQLVGTGSLQKQGGGTLIFTNPNNTWNGSLQVGNGAVSDTATSSIGDGDLLMYQSSNNSPTLNLFSANQQIRNLASSFVSTSPVTQVINLNTTTLTINATQNESFGYGTTNSFTNAYTSVIQDGTSSNAGGVVYNGAAGATLSLNSGNTYHGGTKITGGVLNLANGYNGSSFGVNGSALGVGDAEVESGGTLASGSGASVLGQTVTTGGFSGNLTVDSGGTVIPGGSGLVGSLAVGGGITAHTGSIFDFELAGGISATASTISAGGALTLDNGGTETVNILGSQLASGNYTLGTFGALANAGTAFTLGTDPAGRNRSYSLTTNSLSPSSSDLVLSIIDSGSEWYWSVGGTGGSSGTPVDGAGNWAAGSTNFFTSNPATNAVPYSNTSTNDVIFGGNSASNNGGLITLTGPVTVGGALVFSTISPTHPYTIGTSGGNTLTLSGGIVGGANAIVSAPLVLSGSQTFTAASGTTLTVNGGIAPTTATLTTGDAGTVVLGGTNQYSGGTIISNGTLETSAASLPTSNGVQINNSSSALVFNQTSSGTYSGQISGTGNVTVTGSSTLTLSNSGNSYSGATNVDGSVLSVGSVGALGTEAGGIQMAGGTLQFTSGLSFPLGSGNTINLVGGTTSYMDTDGNNVTLGQHLTGIAGNLTKIGAGELTLTGLQQTVSIGQVSVLGGSLNFDAAANYGFSASTTPGTFTGDLILSDGVGVRLQNGTTAAPDSISGGGVVRMVDSGVNLTAYGVATVANQIFLNQNDEASYSATIGTNAAGNILTITGGITNNQPNVDPNPNAVADVDFSTGGGTVVLSGTASTYTGTTDVTGGEVQLLTSNVLPSTTDLHIGGSGTLDVYGVTATVGTLASGSAPTNATVIDDSNNNGTLVIGGPNTTKTTFAGSIVDDANSSGGGQLAIELSSTYTGELEIDQSNSQGFNSYSGGTILDGGTLETSSDDYLGDSLANPSANNYASNGFVSGITFGGGTLKLDGAVATSRPLTINAPGGTIDVTSSGSFALSGNSNLTWNGGNLVIESSTAPVTITQTGGTIGVTNTPSQSTLTVTPGTTVNVNGTVDPFTDSSHPANHVAIANSGSLNVTGASVSVAGVTGSGTLTIGDGVTANTLQLATSSGDSAQTALVINGSSKMDITNNTFTVATTGADNNLGVTPDPVFTTIYNWIKSGTVYSSSAYTNPTYGVGLVDGNDGVHGTLVSANEIEVAYTLEGDANLDGKVDGSDFSIFAPNFGLPTTLGWEAGDFNYDGKVDGSDFSAFAPNFGLQDNGVDLHLPAADYVALDAFAAANGLTFNPVSVPEPASAGLLLAAGIGVLARRRRRGN